MSKIKKLYYDLCEADNWQAEQSADPDYPAISMDYSESSWEQFEKDLYDKDSLLNKALFNYINQDKS